jgi:virginiamycin A acetyltransferase
VGGNPAKVIKYRFDDSTISQLQAIAWWDWCAEKITENLHAIVGCDLAALQQASDM